MLLRCTLLLTFVNFLCVCDLLKESWIIFSTSLPCAFLHWKFCISRTSSLLYLYTFPIPFPSTSRSDIFIFNFNQKSGRQIKLVSYVQRWFEDQILYSLGKGGVLHQILSVGGEGGSWYDCRIYVNTVMAA